MAKIGSSPEWLCKDLFLKLEDLQQDRSSVIEKYNQTIDSLHKQIEDLHREIELKDRTINMMSIDFDPVKKNLLLKLALICDKLKLHSEKDYEA